MGTPLMKRAYNLGLKAVPNFEVLSEEEIEYYERHLDQLPLAIRRGFVLPGTKPIPVSPVFQTAGTDLDEWLGKAEEFAQVHLGITVNLRQMFAIPAQLPWPSALPIFDPGTLTNRGTFKLLGKLGLNPWEETDVMEYSGSKANSVPSLQLIANSARPDADTLTSPGQSPDDLLRTGKSYLRFRGYGLASGLLFSTKKEHLDPEETWTWFPEDRLADGYVANGCWRPVYGQLRFNGGNPGHRYPLCGARVAISCPLAP